MHPFHPPLVALLMGIAALIPSAQVVSQQKISSISGGFTGVLADDDLFGATVATPGDLDLDGTPDLVVGATNDGDGGPARGAVWVLMLNPDGSVRSHTKVSSTQGGLTGMLDDGDKFGRSLAPMGDLDGDGLPEIVVGAKWDDDGGPDRGAVWLLSIARDGTARVLNKISSTSGGFAGTLADDDNFGVSATSLGDLDGDGVADLAVGAFLDDDGGSGRGAVWILFLNGDGSVRSQAKISSTRGGFTGVLDDGDLFGTSLAGLGDLDGDGTPDLAVGARNDDDGGPDRGAVWILFLNRDGSVRSHSKISATAGGFAGPLDDSDRFARGVAFPGDLDGDGTGDLAVGSPRDDDGGSNQSADRGALWLLYLRPDGSVKAEQKISSTSGGFTGILDNGDKFARALAPLGDFDGNGTMDLVVGAYLDDDGGNARGAAWIVHLGGIPLVQPYGCGANPPGSLTLGAGLPVLGNTLVLQVDNPLGTQPVGSAALLFLSLRADPSFPCGTALPGLGMAGGGAAGELLLDLSPDSLILPISVGSSPWAGPGVPISFPLQVPVDAVLVGLQVHAQGAMVDGAPGAALPASITGAMRFRIGL